MNDSIYRDKKLSPLFLLLAFGLLALSVAWAEDMSNAVAEPKSVTTDRAVGAFSPSQALTYTYESLGRLTFVEDNLNGNPDYDYDPAGNRVAVVVGSDDDGGSDVIIIPNKYPKSTL